MKIVIDADACPVTKLTAKIAKEMSLNCIIVCDTAHFIEIENCRTVTVDKGADSADYKIVSLVNEGDIAVTQDYGLAAMCLAKKCKALNQNGMIYSDKNIENLLYTRFVHKEIRSFGGRTKGPKKRTREQDEAFEKALRYLISTLCSPR